MLVVTARLSLDAQRRDTTRHEEGKSMGTEAAASANRVVSIPAKPEPITIHTATTAAVVVDMQNDFCSKGGMFDRAGIDISATRGAVEPTARILACVRKTGINVIYLKMGFRPDLSDFGAADAPNHIKHLPLAVGTTIKAPDGRQSRILIRDTWNTDIVDELQPQAGDTVIYKTRYSGFYETELDSILKERGVKSLIIVGVSTSVCVESTLRDAMYRDYRCILVSDCAGESIGHELSRTNHDASLLVIQILFGWVSSSAEIIRTLGAGGT
jgi:ureidoacrylate peracid hydrolase